MGIRSKKIIHSSLFGSRIQCRFCRIKFLGTKQYFQHVKKVHLPSISKCDLIKIAQEHEEQPQQTMPTKKVFLQPLNANFAPRLCDFRYEISTQHAKFASEGCIF